MSQSMPHSYIRAFCSCAYLLLMFFASISQLAYSQQEDLAALRDSSKRSVLFISTEWRDADGRNKGGTTGTGFIVSEQGYAVTAAHVVPAAEGGKEVFYYASAQSRFASRYPVKVIKRDLELDVALLQLPDVSEQWTPLKFGDSARVPVATSLFTLGFPANSDLSATTGILSNRAGPRGQWQTDMPLNYGSSGGPVFFKGEVVGMAAGGYDSANRITFVIPSSFIKAVISGIVDLQRPNTSVSTPSILRTVRPILISRIGGAIQQERAIEGPLQKRPWAADEVGGFGYSITAPNLHEIRVKVRQIAVSVGLGNAADIFPLRNARDDRSVHVFTQLHSVDGQDRDVIFSDVLNKHALNAFTQFSNAFVGTRQLAGGMCMSNEFERMAAAFTVDPAAMTGFSGGLVPVLLEMLDVNGSVSTVQLGAISWRSEVRMVGGKPDLSAGQFLFTTRFNFLPNPDIDLHGFTAVEGATSVFSNFRPVPTVPPNAGGTCL